MFEKIKRFFFWGYALRNNHDWDSGYLEEMILIKLKRMKHTLDNDKYHMNEADYRRELLTCKEYEREHLILGLKAHKALRLCIDLLTRRFNESYYDKISGLEYYWSLYTLDFENTTIVTRCVKTKELADPAVYKDIFLKAASSERRLKDRDRKLLYKIMGEYIESWWN